MKNFQTAAKLVGRSNAEPLGDGLKQFSQVELFDPHKEIANSISARIRVNRREHLHNMMEVFLSNAAPEDQRLMYNCLCIGSRSIASSLARLDWRKHSPVRSTIPRPSWPCPLQWRSVRLIWSSSRLITSKRVRFRTTLATVVTGRGINSLGHYCHYCRLAVKGIIDMLDRCSQRIRPRCLNQKSRLHLAARQSFRAKRN